VFAKLFDQAEIANYSDDEYAAYEESLKYYRDLKNSIDTAFDEGVIEGELKGKIEGIIEGKIEGIIEGEVRGKIEGKVETAIKMKKTGYAISDIVEITGLSIEKLKQL